MATEAEIASVQAMLGGADQATENGWDPNKIEEMIDGGTTDNAIAALYWEERYAATSELIDISESGSSRGLSAVTRNARDLAALYRKRVDDEVTPPDARQGIRSHRMTRV